MQPQARRYPPIYARLLIRSPPICAPFRLFSEHFLSLSPSSSSSSSTYSASSIMSIVRLKPILHHLLPIENPRLSPRELRRSELPGSIRCCSKPRVSVSRGLRRSDPLRSLPIIRAGVAPTPSLTEDDQATEVVYSETFLLKRSQAVFFFLFFIFSRCFQFGIAWSVLRIGNIRRSPIFLVICSSSAQIPGLLLIFGIATNCFVENSFNFSLNFDSGRGKMAGGGKGVGEIGRGRGGRIQMASGDWL